MNENMNVKYKNISKIKLIYLIFNFRIICKRITKLLFKDFNKISKIQI
jgi:hypothetical protein